MSTALDRIVDYKRDEVAALKRAESFASLSRAATEASPVRGFRSRHGTALPPPARTLSSAN